MKFGSLTALAVALLLAPASAETGVQVGVEPTFAASIAAPQCTVSSLKLCGGGGGAFLSGAYVFLPIYFGGVNVRFVSSQRPRNAWIFLIFDFGLFLLISLPVWRPCEQLGRQARWPWRVCDVDSDTRQHRADRSAGEQRRSCSGCRQRRQMWWRQWRRRRRRRSGAVRREVGCRASFRECTK